MEWQLALKDADTCIGERSAAAAYEMRCPRLTFMSWRSAAMEPSFIKGWSRKAGIHYYLKEYHKAMDAYNAILKLEPGEC